MTYELLFTFMVALSVIVLGLWAVYELVQCFHSRRPDILPPPRMDRIVRTGRDGYTFEITKGD